MKKGDRVVVEKRYKYSGMTGSVIDIDSYCAFILFDEKNNDFNNGSSLNLDCEKRCYWLGLHKLKKIYDDFIKI